MPSNPSSIGLRPAWQWPRSLALGLCLTSSLACQAPPTSPSAPAILPAPDLVTSPDPHSFARPDEVRVTHLELDLEVSFESRTLSGRAVLTLQRQRDASRLVLDTRDLLIRRVRLQPSGNPATFRLGGEQPVFGQYLEIELTPGTRAVEVEYATGSADALLWMTPQQTAGGRHPFLFSQSQAILARTWIPCQDTPGVRMTYEATIRVPPGLRAVMSAAGSGEVAADGVYRFSMPQPIPSYLLALAVGDLELRPLDQRSGVYAEPEVVERAAWELADTPRMVAAAEALFGPYRWERFDLLVLPASFPFGGMENPRLTFLTPTILAGDRSLVSLIAHELAHSWSGNLVTNATWNDFWLNEGFTSYIESRIMEELYGADQAEMLSELGRQDLLEDLDELGAESPDTHLRLDLAGRDPDGAVTDVAYEKGASLLRLLERTVGREAWDPFLRSWFDQHAFQSVDTDRFLAYLDQNLLAGRPGREALRIPDWVDGPGLPDNALPIDARALRQVEAELERLLAGTEAAALTTTGWGTHQWRHFLRHLPADVSARQMGSLDRVFRFSDSGNSEILFEWLRKAVGAGYEPAYPALERFLTGMGRRRFLVPLYRDLARIEGGRERALAIYRRARPSYHAMAVDTLDEILAWPASSGATGEPAGLPLRPAPRSLGAGR